MLSAKLLQMPQVSLSLRQRSSNAESHCCCRRRRRLRRPLRPAESQQSSHHAEGLRNWFELRLGCTSEQCTLIRILASLTATTLLMSPPAWVWCGVSLAAAADEPKSNFGTLLKLGALFAGWYLANIYFNM